MRLPYIVVAVGVLAGCTQPQTAQPRVLPDKPAGYKNVGIVIYDELFITELSGPMDAYHHVAADKINVFTVAPSMDMITTYEKIKIQPDFDFTNAPRIDILVVPSGNNNLDATYTRPGTDLDNTAMVDFVKAKAATAEEITSHCWGAFILAKAGLLEGKNATTFPGYEDVLHNAFPNVTVSKTARWVEDGNIVSSNGGLAAYEASTHVVRKFFGDEVASKVANGLVMGSQNLAYTTNPTRQ
jgi:transcriptional regulator GlxA family with amidase domain